MNKKMITLKDIYEQNIKDGKMQCKFTLLTADGQSSVRADRVANLYFNPVIDCKTRSGRKFRFDVSAYGITVDTPAWRLCQLAEQIVAEKYRECKWDREHPTVNSQAEVLEAVTQEIGRYVEFLKHERRD